MMAEAIWLINPKKAMSYLLGCRMLYHGTIPTEERIIPVPFNDKWPRSSRGWRLVVVMFTFAFPVCRTNLDCGICCAVLDFLQCCPSVSILYGIICAGCFFVMVVVCQLDGSVKY